MNISFCLYILLLLLKKKKKKKKKTIFLILLNMYINILNIKIKYKE